MKMSIANFKYYELQRETFCFVHVKMTITGSGPGDTSEITD